MSSNSKNDFQAGVDAGCRTQCRTGELVFSSGANEFDIFDSLCITRRGEAWHTAILVPKMSPYFPLSFIMSTQSADKWSHRKVSFWSQHRCHWGRIKINEWSLLALTTSSYWRAFLYTTLFTDIWRKRASVSSAVSNWSDVHCQITITYNISAGFILCNKHQTLA